MGDLETGMEDTGLQAMGAFDEPSQLEEEEEGFEDESEEAADLIPSWWEEYLPTITGSIKKRVALTLLHDLYFAYGDCLEFWPHDRSSLMNFIRLVQVIRNGEDESFRDTRLKELLEYWEMWKAIKVQDGKITWTLDVITALLFSVQFASSQEEQDADKTLESEKCLKEKILGVVALASPVEGASTSEIMGLVGRAQFPASQPGHAIRSVSGLRWERKGSNGGIRYFLKEREGYAERELAQLMKVGKGLLAVQMLQRMKLLFWEREWPSTISAVILGLRFCGVELTDVPFILSAWEKLNTKGRQKKVSSLESLKKKSSEAITWNHDRIEQLEKRCFLLDWLKPDNEEVACLEQTLPILKKFEPS